MQTQFKKFLSYKFALIPVIALLITALAYQNCGNSKQVTSSDVSTLNVNLATLAPQSASILAGATITITAANAPSGSTFVLLSGDGSVDANTGVYTAPATATVAVIALLSNGYPGTSFSAITVTVPVVVIPTPTPTPSATSTPAPTATPVPVTLSPSTAVVPAGNTTTFVASGGTGTYVYAIVAGGTGTGTIDPVTGNFTGLTAGSVVISATDTAGASANASLSVSATICQTTAGEGATATLVCPTGTTVQSVDFASYGTPTGICAAFTASSCNATTSVPLVTAACSGQATCSIVGDNTVFGDPCLGTTKHLSIQVTCY